MNGWNEYAMKQEQYRDQLRGAEQHRLVKLVADDCQEAPFGQAIRNLVSGMTQGAACRAVRTIACWRRQRNRQPRVSSQDPRGLTDPEGLRYSTKR
jgi:hypothetical protein